MIRVVVRSQPRRTHCKRGHPFDEENTYTSPAGQRMCRTCQAMSQARRAGRPYAPKRVTVECPECADRRVVNARQARRIEVGEATGLCGSCRRPSAEVVVPLRENLHQFWRSRFTQDEIDELWSHVSLYLDLELAA